MGRMGVCGQIGLISFSNVRQVPDNQEVFVDMDTQQSLIIELLEPVEAVNEDLAR